MTGRLPSNTSPKSAMPSWHVCQKAKRSYSNGLSKSQKKEPLILEATTEMLIIELRKCFAWLLSLTDLKKVIPKTYLYLSHIESIESLKLKQTSTSLLLVLYSTGQNTQNVTLGLFFHISNLKKKATLSQWISVNLYFQLYPILILKFKTSFPTLTIRQHRQKGKTQNTKPSCCSNFQKLYKPRCYSEM